MLQPAGSIDSPPGCPKPRSWCVLVVDDEPEVRQVTRLVLAGVQFDGRRLEILEADSAARASEILRARNDVAVMLLDVVMESPQAGLQLVRHVREELGNRLLRIVLRTGQPGEAPELDVVTAYDINDYREKTELTATRLIVTLYTALRAYADLCTIEAQRRGLECVIASSTQIFARRNASDFIHAMVRQLVELLGSDVEVLCCEPPDSRRDGDTGFTVLTGTGRFQGLLGRDPVALLPAVALDAMRDACANDASHYGDSVCVLRLSGVPASQHLLFVCLAHRFTALNWRILRLFATNAAIAWNNLHLESELLDAQQEMVCLLASTAETRSRETASHVHRVGLLAGMLANALGLDTEWCELLRLAAPLHDIGKVGIPDPVLNKAGAHTETEARVMRTHAEIGAKLLGNSQRPVMRLAAEIALTHHENWDGSGYPTGLAGEAIPLSGRITMVADVFDALGSRRCYKEPWPHEAIRAHLEAQRSHKFDPVVLDELFAHWDEAVALRDRFPD